MKNRERARVASGMERDARPPEREAVSGVSRASGAEGVEGLATCAKRLRYSRVNSPARGGQRKEPDEPRSRAPVRSPARSRSLRAKAEPRRAPACPGGAEAETQPPRFGVAQIGLAGCLGNPCGWAHGGVCALGVREGTLDVQENATAGMGVL